MKYMLMLYDAPEIDPKLEEEEFPQWMEYTQKLKESRGASRRRGPGRNRYRHHRSGKSRQGYDLIDGPFAETKEVLSGFYMIEAENLDEATKWASQAPHVGHGGTVEIRPILEMPDP
jgi:hypothetical protein